MSYLNIEKVTLKNKLYRKVIYTDKHMQLVLMTLLKNESIPLETHKNVTQFIRVEKGRGIAKISGKVHRLHDGVSLIIPAGKSHEIHNTGDESLHLYSIYCPPEHSAKTRNFRQPK